MVKPRPNPHLKTPAKRFRWWRGLLGALLTFLIIVPYIMGGDVEKYLRQWLSAFNQSNSPFHLELVHYKRHWFSSEGDIRITGEPFKAGLNLHLKAYHGPLFLNAGHGIRLGLSLLKASIDPQELLGQQEALKMTGPVQLTAFIPYFSDRELRTQFPALRIEDKKNKLLYSFTSLSGTIDGDGLFQMQLPSFKVSRPDGSSMDVSGGLLRILPDNFLASFAAKQIDIYRKDSASLTMSNFYLQATTQTNSGNPAEYPLDVALHFDQLQDQALANLNHEILDLGPFDFKLNIRGFHWEGLLSLLEKLKTLNLQHSETALLRKTFAGIFSGDTVYELTSHLNTQNGDLKAEFHGGFHSKAAFKDSAEWIDAFYSQGSIELTADLRDTLSQFTGAGKPRDPENLPGAKEIAMAAFIGMLKPFGDNYATQVDIHQGKVILKAKASHA